MKTTRRMAFAASTRASFGIIGVLLGMLAYTTHYGYTKEQLPLRDLLVVMLVAMSVVGVMGMFLRPTRQSRSFLGVGLMIHSAFRAGVLLAFAHGRNDGAVELLQGSSGVIVHFIVFYLGFLIWVRPGDNGGRDET